MPVIWSFRELKNHPLAATEMTNWKLLTTSIHFSYNYNFLNVKLQEET